MIKSFFKLITLQLKVFMKSPGLEFRKFREETRTKASQAQAFRSPLPTSFREISESREKNKLISAKKSILDYGISLKCPLAASPIHSAKK